MTGWPDDDLRVDFGAPAPGSSNPMPPEVRAAYEQRIRASAEAQGTRPAMIPKAEYEALAARLRDAGGALGQAQLDVAEHERHERRIYIAGPMTGEPEHGLPAFHAAAESLRAEGWEVLSPAEMQTAEQMADVARLGASYKGSPTYCACMLRDIWALLTCSAIHCLPGWWRSSGASVERAVAVAIGLDVLGEPLLPQPAVTTVDPAEHERVRAELEAAKATLVRIAALPTREIVCGASRCGKPVGNPLYGAVKIARAFIDEHTKGER